MSDIIRSMRLVLDTNVLLAGLFSRRGAFHWLVRKLLDRAFEAAATVPVFLEYEAVLLRPENLEQIAWSPSNMQAFLTDLSTLLLPIQVWYLWRPGFSAPTDEMFVECAVASSADALVTFNKRDYLDAARRFKFTIRTPGEIVFLLKQVGAS